MYSPTGTAGWLLFVCWLLVCCSLLFIGLCVCLGVMTLLASVNIFN